MYTKQLLAWILNHGVEYFRLGLFVGFGWAFGTAIGGLIEQKLKSLLQNFE